MNQPVSREIEALRRNEAMRVAHAIMGVLLDADERGVTFPHAELLRQAFNTIKLFTDPPLALDRASVDGVRDYNGMTPEQHVAMVLHGKFGVQVCLNEAEMWVPIAHAALSAISIPRGEVEFQARVQPWMMACFGPEISADKLERNDRFIEEALELVQASGYTQDRAHALVDYTFNRPQGDINQEVGGVMVTLAAHCLASGVNMHEAGETELKRIWTKVDQIRANKPRNPEDRRCPCQSPSPPAGGWRDIATAPKDGTFILCWVPGTIREDNIQTMKWAEYRHGHFYWMNAADSNRPEDEPPTFWMPLLPAPPASDK